MIPCTDICVTSAHVPYPILANTQYMNTFVHEPRVHYPTTTPQPGPMPSRRGRRSTIPPEIREQTRRLKKQNMERRRRACISDKMNALHNLALSIVGVDPQESPKVEKADILSICYSVFQGIAKIAKDDPELTFRLHNLRDCLREQSTSSTNSQPNALHLFDETTRSSTVSDDSCSRTNSPFHPQSQTPLLQHHENKENLCPSKQSVMTLTNQPSYNLPNTSTSQPIGLWHSTPLNPIKLRIKQSPDSGFQSLQEGTRSINQTHCEPSPLFSPSSLPKACPNFKQEHEFPKPIGPLSRSAFTPVRSTKTSPLSVFNSPTSVASSTVPTRSSSESVRNETSTHMWRPYLD